MIEGRGDAGRKEGRKKKGRKEERKGNIRQVIVTAFGLFFSTNF